MFNEDRHEEASVIREYHVYESVRAPVIGVERECSLKLRSYEHLFLCCAIVHVARY